MIHRFVLALSLATLIATVAPCQNNGEPSVDGPSLTAPVLPASDSIMITVVLRHQQDKNLAEIRRRLEAQGFWGLFPPPDVRVVSWTIAMGYGHIITLMAPASAVRRINLAIENGAWGAYDSDIYLSYDYLPVWKDYIQRREEAAEDRE